MNKFGLYEQLEDYLNPGEKAGGEAERIIREFEQHLAQVENERDRLESVLEEIKQAIHMHKIVGELTAPKSEKKS